ncbi:DUF4157 domain-containing protein [Aquimarina sp. AD1]|uniref:eCIS core domain-containing protein n=1 Tax=Aquimarina sp. (strain AD1) TaxID=1714848 RepID=UPI000E4E0AC7|nr:DUF4157 domain-containing protein [Aquimarina sp. AD1]AXT55864.1 DUF4157 domain-containing protein [Aquimarina sp. AD1]RKN29329.1 DUF4157 domain-containing protein [Aquimarina sp. AD1]
MRLQKRRKSSPKQQHEKPFIQPKLKVGKPGDKHEVEADQMADQVVNKTNDAGSAVQKKEATEEDKVQASMFKDRGEGQVRRKEEEEPVQKMEEEEPVQKQEEEKPVQAMEEEEPVQKQEEEEPVQAMEEEEPVQKQEEEEAVQKMEEEEPVQKKEEEEPVQAKEEEKVQKKGTNQNGNTNIESRLKSRKGKGVKLSRAVKTEMESGFGADFSAVNIHTDTEAVKLSEALGAQAFTHGNDIYFNDGKFNPNSKRGKHLLAHELTHTIQQKGKIKKNVQKHWKKSQKHNVVSSKKVKVDIDLDFKGAVLNKSSNATLNASGLANAAKTQIENSFKGSMTKSMFGLEFEYDIKTTANVRVINKLMDLQFTKEHLFVVLDDSHPKVNGTYGSGPFYGTLVYLNEKHTPGMISGADMNTIPHEVGHTSGLKHLIEKGEESNLVGKIIKELHHNMNNDNMMWRGGGHPTYNAAQSDSNLVKTNEEQLSTLMHNINAGKLNKLDFWEFMNIMK